MKIGFVGLGKLGMPVAVAIANSGHSVIGYDANPHRMTREWPFREEGYRGRPWDQWVTTADLTFGTLADVVRESDLVFLAVQTPHALQFEGITPLPADRADFDYSYLERAICELDEEADRQQVRLMVVVISTVLPGTIGERILPLCHRLEVIYNPAFPAMGTVIRDYLDPEFVLLGTRGPNTAGRVRGFYEDLVSAPILETAIVTAETIKVLYNTYITAKIVLANTAMEVCHKVGANVDDVSRSWALATRRITSGAYTRGGMGDGGACHPRDNIALSWLARKAGLSFDLFGTLMEARECQAGWLCYLVGMYSAAYGYLPICLLGTAFKAGTNIETGSAALLCKYILEERYGGHIAAYDPVVGRGTMPDQACVFLVGCNHPEFAELVFPAGSVVVDPWRMIPDQAGVDVVRIGE